MDSTNWDKLKGMYKSAEDFLADMPIGKAIANVINNPTPQEIGAQVANLGSDISKALSKTTENPVEAVLNYSPMGAMVAWHGSPYKFSKFQMNKIGTGEGAQAYGHGLYFAGNPETAESYKMAGEISKKGISDEEYAASIISMFGGDKTKTLEHLKKILPEEGASTFSGESRERILGVIQSLKEGTYKNKSFGNIYKVDLPEENLMLDWDAPLNTNPKEISSKIKNLSNSRMVPTGEGEYTGEQVYKELIFDYLHRWENPLTREQAAKKVSEDLKSLGIKGIKYYDAGSRAKGKGTRNYVIFNEDDIKILERNAEKFLEGE